MKTRLNKYLSQCGVSSRRKADEYISQGRVKVNGKTVRSMGVRVDSGKDRVEVDGREISAQTKEYIMLNKPPGYLVTRSDSFNRRTVMDLLPAELKSLFPVGRLDKDSEGLLLLTNDGELAHRLMHPRYEIMKKYTAEINGHPKSRELSRIRKGIMVEGRLAVPDEVRIIRKNTETTMIEVRLHEGRKREIRRMFQSEGYRVMRLRRVSFDGLILGKLKCGKWRRLKPGEVQKLRNSAENVRPPFSP